MLGLLLDRDGPTEIGMLVGRLADGAIIDTRVLLAHRHGPDEAAWPAAEDRFASTSCSRTGSRDPWLKQLTLTRGRTRSRSRSVGTASSGPGSASRSASRRDGRPGAPRRPIVLGLRRVDELDPGAPLPESDPRLVRRIADEIRASGR